MNLDTFVKFKLKFLWNQKRLQKQYVICKQKFYQALREKSEITQKTEKKNEIVNDET